MITDSDVKKLKKVFATKQDLADMENRQNKKFATKDDLKKFATKDDLKYFKEDIEAGMEKQKKEIIEAIGDLVSDSLIPILDNHEDRITKLESHTPATS